MSVHSIESNMMSVFTDCPGREKLPYGADYVQPMGSLTVNYDFAAYLRNMEVQLVEGQSKPGIDAGNVALKTPVYDWGYSGQFGDEINWGSSIVQVPWQLYKLYGDTQTMREHWDAMKTYMDFVARQQGRHRRGRVHRHALLADWVAAEQTSRRIFGTWGYYIADSKNMATWRRSWAAPPTPRRTARSPRTSRTAYNAGSTTRRCAATRRPATPGPTGATQAAQALALDAGLVARRRAARTSCDALVEQHLRFHPVRRRPALQRRPHRPRPGRAGR